MKIQLVSDLHLEFGDITIPNAGNTDVLILSGDICLSRSFKGTDYYSLTLMAQAELQRYRDFFLQVATDFPYVVYVTGNHEFYHGYWPDGINYLKNELSKYSNFHVLELESVTIHDVKFLGGTLWTDFNNQDVGTKIHVASLMNDFRIIKNKSNNYKFTVNNALERHLDTKLYLEKELSNFNGKTVVVGHHAPSKQSIKPKYEKDVILNGAYSSNLEDFILKFPQIKLWTHGHTHDSFDYFVGSTRVVCNPRGYYNYEENIEFDPLKVIEI